MVSRLFHRLPWRDNKIQSWRDNVGSSIFPLPLWWSKARGGLKPASCFGAFPKVTFTPSPGWKAVLFISSLCSRSSLSHIPYLPVGLLWARALGRDGARQDRDQADWELHQPAGNLLQAPEWHHQEGEGDQHPLRRPRLRRHLLQLREDVRLLHPHHRVSSPPPTRTHFFLYFLLYFSPPYLIGGFWGVSEGCRRSWRGTNTTPGGSSGMQRMR